jgi:hypothetical protein
MQQPLQQMQPLQRHLLQIVPQMQPLQQNLKKQHFLLWKPLYLQLYLQL